MLIMLINYEPRSFHQEKSLSNNDQCEKKFSVATRFPSSVAAMATPIRSSTRSSLVSSQLDPIAKERNSPTALRSHSFRVRWTGQNHQNPILIQVISQWYAHEMFLKSIVNSKITKIYPPGIVISQLADIPVLLPNWIYCISQKYFTTSIYHGIPSSMSFPKPWFTSALSSHSQVMREHGPVHLSDVDHAISQFTMELRHHGAARFGAGSKVKQGESARNRIGNTYIYIYMLIYRYYKILKEIKGCYKIL